MNAKFTPGPWSVCVCNNGAAISVESENMPTYREFYPRTSSEGHFDICKSHYSRDKDITESGSQKLEQINWANANLIAAAPVMYDAMQIFLNKLLYSPDGQVVMKFNDLAQIKNDFLTILAKARGGNCV